MVNTHSDQTRFDALTSDSLPSEWVTSFINSVYRGDISKLDFSVNSLKQVDEFLEFVRGIWKPKPTGITKLLKLKPKPEIDNATFSNIVLRAGSYVGEVVRRNSSRSYKWVEKSDWMKSFPEQVHLLGSQIDLPTCFLLMSGGAWCLPMNKVCKRIDAGDEDSV